MAFSSINISANRKSINRNIVWIVETIKSITLSMVVWICMPALSSAALESVISEIWGN
jgi:hypothetical protein